MPSENNHIDNFLRNKASEATVDTSGADAGWQQMKESLVKPSSPPLKPASRVVRFKRFLPYAAGAIMVVTTVTIMVLPGKNRSNKITEPVTEKRTIGITPDNNYLATAPRQWSTNNPALVTQRTPAKDNSFFDYYRSSSLLPADTIIKKDNDIIKTIAIKPDAQTVFASFYDELEKETQEFVVDPKKDTTIVCKEGSSLFVPAGVFQTFGGKTIDGNVTISIQEFYSFADIISNKLSTTSNSMPLETGGMLSIKASADSKEVMIRPGTFLELKMPTRDFNPEMQLFVANKPALTLMDTVKSSLPFAFQTELVSDTVRVTGSRTFGMLADRTSRPVDMLNWEPAGQQQFFFNEKAKEITLFNVTDNPYETSNYKNGTKTLAKFRIPFDASISTDAMQKLLTKKYGHFYDKIKVKREWGTLFNREKEKDVTKTEWYKSGYVGDSIIVSLSLASRLKLIGREDSLAYEAAFLKRFEDAKKQKRSYQEFLEKRNEYSFRIGNMGWINCDRFINYPASRLTDYAVNPGPGFEDIYFQAMMVFEKEKAIMAGTWYNGVAKFQNIPVGHAVYLICTGVKGGKMYSCVQSMTVRKGQVPALQFEETSPEQFREKLAKFGNVKFN